jgi:hypothetical protein
MNRELECNIINGHLLFELFNKLDNIKIGDIGVNNLKLLRKILELSCDENINFRIDDGDLLLKFKIIRDKIRDNIFNSDDENKKIRNSIILQDIIIFNSLCIGAFVMFSMFVIASLCGKLRVRLEGKLRVCESYLFLVMGSIFGKYILFVWDECQEGDVDVDMEVNEWKGDLLMGDDSVDCGDVEDKVKKYEPSINSKMTFNKVYANGNNAWKQESSVVLKDNNNVSIEEEEEENNMDIFSFRKNKI